MLILQLYIINVKIMKMMKNNKFKENEINKKK